MAEYSGSTALRGARSPTKDSTVYNRGGYRAAPPIYETGDDGNLRPSTGNPARAGATPAPTDAPAATAPAFTQTFADTPRPQGSNLLGSAAQSALVKAGGKVVDSAWSTLRDGARYTYTDSANPYGPGLDNNDTWAGPGISPTLRGARESYNYTNSANPYGPGIDNADTAAGPGMSAAEGAARGFIDADTGLSYGAGSLGAASDLADGVSAGVDLATGLDIGAGSLGAASDLADGAGAIGDAASSVPVAGPLVRLAQGDVGGAAGSFVGGLVGGPIGAVIGGAIAGGRVICTELVAQGLMDADMLAADLEFTARLDPAVIRGYHAWAIPYVRLMRRSRLATAIVRPFALWRGRAVLHAMGRGPRCWPGSVVRAIGEPLCHLVGLLVGPQDFTVLQKGESA